MTKILNTAAIQAALNKWDPKDPTPGTPAPAAIAAAAAAALLIQPPVKPPVAISCPADNDYPVFYRLEGNKVHWLTPMDFYFSRGSKFYYSRPIHQIRGNTDRI